MARGLEMRWRALSCPDTGCEDREKSGITWRIAAGDRLTGREEFCAVKAFVAMCSARLSLWPRGRWVD